jgi:hypothetical protein
MEAMPEEPNVVQTMRRFDDALLARDWAALADVLDEKLVFDDRRTGLQSTFDKAQTIELSRIIADLGMSAIESDLIETHGESLAMYRMTLRGSEADYEVALLGVTQIGSDGRALRVAFFDENALDDARAQFDALAREIKPD